MKKVKAAQQFGLALVFLTIVLTLWVRPLEAARLVFGGFYILFVPGLIMTYAFFDEKELTIFERFPFAFGLSLVTVSLTTFSLFRAGMMISPWTILAVVTGLSLLAAGVAFMKQKGTLLKS